MLKQWMAAACVLGAGLGISNTSWADILVSNLPFTPGIIERYTNSGVLVAAVGLNGTILKLSLSAGQNGNYYAAGMALEAGAFYQLDGKTNGSIPLSAAPTSIVGVGTFAVGWNGDLFVPGINRTMTGSTTGIIELNGTTGAYMGTPIVYAGTSSLGFRDVAFSPDNRLYAADSGHIYRYDLSGGSITQDTSFEIAMTFAAERTPTSAGVIRFKGSSPDLYVSDQSSIRVYSGADGSLLSTFLAAGTNGLGTIADFTFGDDGYAYVVSSTNGSASVMRFNATTGNYVDTIIGATFTGPYVPQIAYLSAVPEPASLGILGMGVVAALCRRRR